MKIILASRKTWVILTSFWGEQQAIVAIVAVACIFYVSNDFGGGGTSSHAPPRKGRSGYPLIKAPPSLAAEPLELLSTLEEQSISLDSKKLCNRSLFI